MEPIESLFAILTSSPRLLRSLAGLVCLLIWITQAQCGQPAAPAASRPAPSSARLETALCSAVEQQPDLGNAHLNDLDHQYAAHPATSGPHYPVPLPPQPSIYSSEIPESRAVHNLEHGYVIAYYQPSGADALSPSTLEALRADVQAQHRVLLAPYPRLPGGIGLALAAWRELQRCSGRVSATEARQALEAFAATYRDSPGAPEPGAR